MPNAPYDFAAIEKKWQEIWEEEKTFAATRRLTPSPNTTRWWSSPIPRAQGLHVGHPRSNTAMDIIARKRRMEGYNVLFPIGYDAFGLPTENYAIKNHIHPAIVTEQNIARFRSQLKRLGFSFDCDREINTTDPNYYKWTQWIFLQAVRARAWPTRRRCPSTGAPPARCGLANEEVVGGVCERCGGEVVRKVKSPVDAAHHRLRPEAARRPGRAWTSSRRSRCSSATGSAAPRARRWTSHSPPATSCAVYTTRPDTLFGATYMVMSPGASAASRSTGDRSQITTRSPPTGEAAARKSDFERTELNKDKTGV